MPSATTADSSDSMAPSIAIVNAGSISSIRRVAVTSGKWKDGKPCGIPPKALPMVATPAKWNIPWRAVTATSATSGPGIRFRPGNLDVKITSNSDNRASDVVAGCRCGSACSRCQSFSWKCSPGTAGSPKKSFHCPTQMITAIPAVKPTMTGSGMNLMTAPSWAMPSSSRMAPAIKVAICRPSMPCLGAR